MSECDLAEPVMRWLHNRGFVPYGEVSWFSRGIDVVGIHADGAIETVEMKLSLTKHVIYQANVTLAAADRAWCAVATKPRNLQARIEQGWLKKVGVLRVIDGAVEVLHEAPPPSPRRGERWTDTLLKACAMREPFGKAGMPTMCGVGPAQMVFDRMQKFLVDNPNATWAEIFAGVPNHYCHARSMQGAMRVVQESRERRRLEADRQGGGGE